MPTRAERGKEVARLRGAGLTYREIAGFMDVSYSYVRDLVGDPDGTKVTARKNSYRGTCRDCGAPTTGSNGRAAAPSRCADCTARHQHEGRYWTSERIIASIQEWNRVYGRPPIATEWFQAIDASEPKRPAGRTVLCELGSWSNAIEAAGFPRPTVGHNMRGTKNWTSAENRPHFRSVDELVAELRELSENGVAISTKERVGNKLRNAFAYRGVTWVEACALAGVTPQRPPKEMTVA